MKGRGPRVERETIILFNEAEPDASVYTASNTYYRKMISAGHQPSEESAHSATFIVPKKLVNVRKERKITDKHRATLAKKAPSLRSRTVITEAEHVNNGDEL